jgi:hypothetical protein
MKISTLEISVCLLIQLSFLPCFNSFAQTSSGPRSGSVFTDNNAIGVYSFSSVGNAAVPDDNNASASALLTLLTGNTHYLETSGFGFAIPAGSGITGILVEVRKNATGINIFTSVSDNDVRLLKNGVVAGNSRAKSANWVSTPNYYSYGGTNDLWGTTWTAADINAAGFGLAFSAAIDGLAALLPGAHIDHVRITVYFNIALPVEMMELTGEVLENNNMLIQWAGLQDQDIASVNVQRKIASKAWETIHTISKETQLHQETNRYEDRDCSASSAFYRLQVKYNSDRTAYSKEVLVKRMQSLLSIYPNPASDRLFIRQPVSGAMVTCTGINGRNWPLKVVVSGNTLHAIDIRHLPAGTYVVSVDDKKALFLKR